MRELRKDVGTTLEPSKEELDNMDEMKIEDVLMGLKGLKQDEVFSFLNKSNFTPAETEEWLKMMSSTGFSGYDHLPTVDSVEMEQLQLSFSAHFDGLQGSIGHSCPPRTDHKLRNKSDVRSTINNSGNVSKTQSVTEWAAEDVQHQRVSAMWPKYPGTHSYLLHDFHGENLREEEIIATSIGEELITTSNVDDEDDFKYVQNNTYVIQSSADRVDVPDKSKPIKLLIKRVESEDEAPACPDSESLVTRSKTKRVWNTSTKRRAGESPPKKKKCSRRSLHKAKEKIDASVTPGKETDAFEELDFPFSNTVHQDDEFVYPSLDMSDDEEDVYSFSRRDDETWTPKIKMKINEVKSERPTRNRKRNNAVAKYLEAAALKRADSNKSSKKSQRKLGSIPPAVGNTPRPPATKYSFNAANHSPLPSLPSTSAVLDMSSSSPCSTLNALSPSGELSIVQTSSSSPSLTTGSESSTRSTPVRRGRKAKSKPSPKVHKLHLKADFKGSRLIPPKTCKLIQTPRSAAVVANLQPGETAKHAKSDGAHCSTSTGSSSNADKKVPSSYITKRGKPKKGMATAKQRLGKILKMHKMFF